MDQQSSVQPAKKQIPEVPKATRSLWWLVVMLAVALGLGVWARMSKDEANTNVNTPAANTNVAANTNAATTYLYPGQDGKNALELLKLAYPNTATKSSGSLGEQVMSINGQEAGSNEFWEFLVNGAAATVGAGSYVTKSTDMIEWKLTSF
jgi:hypothetical protein